MAKGTYSAYRQDTPIQEDFSDNISRQETNAFRYREEQRTEDALDKQQAKDDALMAQQQAKDISSVQPVITGVRSVDEINYRATGIAQKRMGDIYRQFKKEPKSQSDVNLRMELENLKNFPKVLSGLQQKMTAYAQDLAKGFSDGTYSKWDEGKIDELEAFFGVEGEDGTITPNYIIDFNEQGNMVAKAITKDGKYFEKSANDIMNGYEYSTPTRSINADDYTDDIAKNLGKKKTSRVNGRFIVEEQSFDTVEGDLRNTIAANLGDARNPSDLAKSVWSDEQNMNRDPRDFNEESLKQVENYLIDQVRSKYDESRTLKNAPRSGSGGGSDRVKGQGLTVMTDTATGKPLKVTKLGQEGVMFSIADPVTFRTGNKEKKFNSIYLGPNDTIMFEGQEKQYKNPNTSTQSPFGLLQDPEPAFKDVTAGVLNEQETNNLAVQLGFKNSFELKEHLKNTVPQQNTKKEDLRSKYNY